ncbi:MAG TPA: SCO family protein [Candidatus Binatia bacterium]|nr:SCO family protein [Candidatus Binatia bacterium]
MSGRGRPLVRIAGLLLVLAAAGVLAAKLLPGDRDEPLPVIAEIPEFRLIEASGRPVTRADLAGKPWVADLIFTSCSGICPAMTQEMSRLAKHTADVPDLRLVSITVDPARDTPEKLTEYAARFGADRSRWLFLTGDDAVIRKLAREGLLLPVAEGDPSQGDEAILHSPRFALIDGRGRVRGSYDMRDAEAMLRLRGDVRRLVEEPSAASG